jgi:hypothetical protein
MDWLAKMKMLFTICKIVGKVGVALLAGVAVFLIGCWLYIGITVGRASYAGRQYITYTRLMGVSSDCDKYKAQYGKWPTNLTQLIGFRPELTDWAKDAWGKGDNVWGRYVILIPYNESLGYGEVVSYGRDGKPGGTGLDRDLIVRFPSEANAAWNKQQGEGLKRPPRQ